MARQLNDQQKTQLAQALDSFIEAGQQLKKAPRFSHRADLMIDRVTADLNVARKLKSEIDPQGETNLPENPPDRPDSGRGDYDNSQSSVPKGLTSTSSMARGSKPDQENSGQGQSGQWSHGPQSEDSDQANQANQSGPRETAPNLTPGLSGHPVKRDDRERHTEYVVDSTSHRAAARGEFGRVDPDVLPGPAKRQPNSETGDQDNGEGEGDESTQSGPLHGDDQRQYQGPDQGGFDQTQANISRPIKGGADTTNTSSEGAPWPDNAFAKDAGDFYQRQDDDDKQADANRAEELERKAATSRKYDSENRVATETLGHAAEKARQAGAQANQAGNEGRAEGANTDSPYEKPEEFSMNPGTRAGGNDQANPRAADDKLGLNDEERQAKENANTNESGTAEEQQARQGDEAAKRGPAEPSPTRH